MLKLLFRADSSTQIGSGHIMRCLTLAQILQAQGASVAFLCCNLPGNLIDWLRETQHITVYVIPETTPSVESLKSLIPQNQWPDWLIIDHYEIDAQWESLMKQAISQLMVIDDLANRPHQCQVLLDQTLCDNPTQRYHGLLPKTCTTLFGPHYALLRSEFKNLRSQIQLRQGPVQRILISFGGSDPKQGSQLTLEALHLLDQPALEINLVVGLSNPQIFDLQEAIKTFKNAVVHIQTNQMAHLMSQADLFIGAAGSTSWEWCCLGLPALILITATNQIDIASALQQAEACTVLGSIDEISSQQLAHEIQTLINNSKQRQQYQHTAQQLVDGLGVERVSEILIKASL